MQYIMRREELNRVRKFWFKFGLALALLMVSGLGIVLVQLSQSTTLPAPVQTTAALPSIAAMSVPTAPVFSRESLELREAISQLSTELGLSVDRLWKTAGVNKNTWNSRIDPGSGTPTFKKHLDNLIQRLQANKVSLTHSQIKMLYTAVGIAVTDELEKEPLLNLAQPEPKALTENAALSKDDASSTDPLNNLPFQLTRFIGREREMQEVKELLNTTRLLTLTGAGGVGKTRLQLEIGFDLLKQYKNGVWLVELAPIPNNRTVILQAIAQVLGVKEEPDQALEIKLISTLKSSGVLRI